MEIDGKVCKLLFGYAWSWQESGGVCSSFIIAGRLDCPQYSEREPEVSLVGTPPYVSGGLCVALFA